MAGYSTRSLIEKLGIKAEYSIALLNYPEHYPQLLGSLPEGISVQDLGKDALDFIQFFTRQKKDLELMFPRLTSYLKETGMIWICWPKGSSKLETDLNENIVRDLGLAIGLVDVKVAAIDEDWSALKFVVRVKDRSKK